MVGLSAQVAICEELCSKTNGDDNNSGAYAVALHEQHFRDLFLAATTPPVTRTAEQQHASLLMMGFPSRALAAVDRITVCACHNRPSREGYACTRCRAKVCRLPAECPACGLTLILSTHLARSYHHLFPLRNWVEVPWTEAGRSAACYSCLAPFPAVSKARLKGKGKQTQREGGGGGSAETTAASGSGPVVPAPEVKGVSESGRYACQVCGNHFCIDCDVFAHEVIHNCPGCQSDIRAWQQDGGEAVASGTNGGGVEMNGSGHTNGSLIAA